MQGQYLDTMILVGPLQLGTVYDSMTSNDSKINQADPYTIKALNLRLRTMRNFGLMTQRQDEW